MLFLIQWRGNIRQLPRQIWQTPRINADVHNPLLWRDVRLVCTTRPSEYYRPCSLATRQHHYLKSQFLSLRCRGGPAELSEDYDEQTIIIAYRMLIGLIGGELFIFFIYGVFPASDNAENGLFDREIINPCADHLALMFVWMTFSTVATLDQVKYLPQPATEVPRSRRRDASPRF